MEIGTVWLVRDSNRGPMQYAIFNKRPKLTSTGFSCYGGIRVDIANEIALLMVRGGIPYRGCVEVICSEVVG